MIRNILLNMNRLLQNLLLEKMITSFLKANFFSWIWLNNDEKN
jgi:hypothetical protein